jgi:hypothetical protein
MSGQVVDLGVDLDLLSRAVAGQPVDWDELADQLGDANRACRRRSLAHVKDAGDSGGR